ncbi:OmpA family protein [Solilutibacter silvestris]|uniref:OmpA-like domain-containing protein n=1 Tax=Solilutibacter silvestris TaxID=1645665 RepID=A0A2K1PY72_9GAMM|nr:OmpA family protein [Lysobacter silvestris]PNS07739.1 hypothetical protein Lysil_1915 [Lysobacter silvestris]
MDTDTSSLDHLAPVIPGRKWRPAWVAAMLFCALSCGQAMAQSFPATLSNTATVTLPANISDPAPANNSATDTNALAATSDLSVIKTVTSASPAAAGSTVTYKFVVSNAGPLDAVGATIADTMPAQLTNVSWTCVAAGTSTCGVASGTGNVNLAANVGQGAANAITVTVSGTAPASGTIAANTATVAAPTGTTDPNPGNNTSTTPTIPVTAQIVANPDNGTVTTAGGVAVANVLANDSLRGATATTATVTLSEVSSSNPSVTLNTATGAVNVAAGAAVGNSTLVYKICGTANPSNCATAPVTVTVTAVLSDLSLVKTVTSASPAAAGSTVTYKLVVNNAGPADAVGAAISDAVPVQLTNVSWTCVATGTSTCGSASGTGNVNLTANVAVGAGNDLTITVNGTAPASGTIDANTATVTVPAGTSDPNPGNNTSTTPTIPVTAAIVANPDSGTVTTAGGVAVANVLANDSLRGATATTATVTLSEVSSSNPSVTLNTATGAVNVAAGAAIGNSALVYKICEIANPSNCATATVTITVTAVQSDLSLVKTVTSASPALAGSTVTYKLVVNNAGPADAAGATISDAVPAQLTNVSWTCVATGTSTCGSASGTGNVNLTANLGQGAANDLTITVSGTAPASGTIGANTATVTVPAGTSDPNPGNNTSTTPTIPVTAAIVANPDSGTVTAAGGVAVPNVLWNDTLAGVTATAATVTLSQVSSSNPSVSLNPATGAVNVAPGAAVGTDTLVYRICETANPGNCAQATVTVTVAATVLSSDLSVVKTVTSASPAAAGSTVTYKLVINNAGPADAVGAAISDAVPVQLTNVSWTCVATGTSTCGSASGTGNVNLTANLGQGAANDLTITVSGTAPASGTIGANTATVTVPAGTSDPNPGNNTSTTPTIPVTAAIVANPDSGTVTAAGGVAVANVLANDSLRGTTATTATVTLSAVSSSSPLVTLNTATGAVNVAAGAAVGNSTLIYKICEIANPTNCATAPATVTVMAATSDLSVVKTVTSASPAAAGSTVTYKLVVNNAGPADAAGATISDTVPVQLTNVSWTCVATGTSTCGSASGTGNVNLTANLGQGAANDLTITVSGTAPTSGTIGANTATVTVPAGTTDPSPGNNTSTTPTIPVTAAIVANPDNGTVTTAGGVAVANVLANDSLRGATATTATVTLSEVSSSNPSVSLNPATGAVNVAAGAAVGNSTLIYKICEIANPTNCTTAPATITVTAVQSDLSLVKTVTSASPALAGSTVTYKLVVNNAGPADAVGAAISDAVPVQLTNVSWTCVATGTSTCGSASGTSNVNLTANVAVGAANDLTITVSGTAPTSGTIAANTATVTVPAGTSDPNPGNNTSTTPTIPVTAAIVANPDSGTVTAAGGVAVANVLANDTLRGTTATTATVTLSAVSSSSPLVTLNTATGAVNVAAGAAVGNSTLIYKICEIANPTNCATAPATVTVTAATSDLSLVKTVTSASPALAGSTVTYKLVVNNVGPADAVGATISDTVPPQLTNVSWTCVASGTSTCGSASGTGNVNLTANLGQGAANAITVTVSGTAPASGTIAANTATVTIPPGSSDPNPGNNTSTTPTIPVTAPIIANPDSGTATTAGGVAVPNVLANDTLAGVTATTSAVTLTPVNNAALTVDPNGSVSVLPGTTAGTYTTTYTICERANPANCSSAIISVLVRAAPVVLRMTMTAAVRTARIGDLVRYTLRVDNVGQVDARSEVLHDTLPAGFDVVTKSLVVADDDAAGTLLGARPLRVGALDVAVGKSATITYAVRVAAGVSLGIHVNRGIINDSNGVAVSNEASADVEIVGDPMLNDSLIVGSVFNDTNGNGRQDPGERGLPGVRLGTVEGLLIETDRYGRFHIDGIDGGRWARGRNFLVKVDTATLPPGSRFTTENPRVLRITPGVPVRFDFGVQVPNTPLGGGKSEVDIDLGEVFFEGNSSVVPAEHLPVVDRIAGRLRDAGGGSVAITANADNLVLAFRRSEAIRNALDQRLSPELQHATRIELRAQIDGGQTLVTLGKDIGLGVLLFDTDKSTIRPQYLPLLAAIAQQVDATPGTVVAISGYADMRGTAKHNMRLSQQRADAVANEIAAHLTRTTRQCLRVEPRPDGQIATCPGGR